MAFSASKPAPIPQTITIRSAKNLINKNKNNSNSNDKMMMMGGLTKQRGGVLLGLHPDNHNYDGYNTSGTSGSSYSSTTSPIIPATTTTTTTSAPTTTTTTESQQTQCRHLKGEFCSNHVLVNLERKRYGRGPLRRSKRLDDLARAHAQRMADCETIQSSVTSIQELQSKLQATLVGENTLRGDSLRAMHHEIMTSTELVPSRFRGNLLANSFTDFGMGTARGAKDGKLYLVQLFAGGEPIVVVPAQDSL